MIFSLVSGVGIMTVVGGYLVSFDGYYDFWSGWLNYSIGGARALPLMIFAANRRRRLGSEQQTDDD